MGFSSLSMNQIIRQHAQCISDGHDGLYVSTAGSSGGGSVRPQDAGDVFIPALSYPSLCGNESQLGENSYFHKMNWRDVFDIGVRWRQLAEPNDPVWWTDRFQEFTDDSFDVVSTPILTGAKRVGRYYTYYNETFALLKKTMRHCYGVGDKSYNCIRLGDEQQRAVDAAMTLDDLYRITGQNEKEIYVVANCTSAASPDLAFPCTKLALSPSRGKGEGWEFRISASYSTRIFSTYFMDLDVLFQRYIAKLVEFRSSSNEEAQEKLVDRIIDEILNILYTWVHCSPLTRGSAALTYTAGAAMLLAAGVCVDGKLPENKQLDWEILISTSPRDFKARIRPWFDTIKRYPITAACPDLTVDWLEGANPSFSMSALFPTPRHILGALDMKY